MAVRLLLDQQGGVEFAHLWWILYVAFIFRGGGRYSMDQYLTKQFEILSQSDGLGETRRGPCPCAHSRFWLAIALNSDCEASSIITRSP